MNSSKVDDDNVEVVNAQILNFKND